MTDGYQHDIGKKGKKVQRKRYWSLMLVGDHGRIIPFARFKGLAIAFVAILLITLIALTVLSFLFWRQTNSMERLKVQLVQMKKQADLLRDEKDVLLARMVIENKIVPEEASPEETSIEKTSSDRPEPIAEKDSEVLPETVNRSDVARNIQPISGQAKAAEDKSPVVKASEPTVVKRGAKIRNFGVTYDRSRSILQARFRIYNDSQPKESLSGRVVVVFKKEQDPPLKWVPVPNVQIANGRPDGKRGQVFKIRNYRTVTLKSYGMKPPIIYNTASVYVFSADGDLIFNQDHKFKIDEPPAPAVQLKPSPPDPGKTADSLIKKEPETSISEQNEKKNTTDDSTENTPETDSTTTDLIYPDPFSVEKNVVIPDQEGINRKETLETIEPKIPNPDEVLESSPPQPEPNPDI